MAAIRLGSHIKELRILLCQTSNASAGVRDFVKTQYVPLKLENPSLPILIRECSDIDPKLYARYEFGKETCIPLKNLKCEDILGKMQELAAAKSAAGVS